MELGLIICEKPSVAKSIAAAVNSKSSRADGYFEGDKYLVTFVFGHMYELYDAKDYDPKLAKWNKENYPFIPSEFKYKARDDGGVRKQLKIIKGLAERKDVDYVVISTDSDMEGQLIGSILINELNIKKPLKRLWISSHTPEEVKKGMNNLKDNKEYINLEKASYCRQWLDFSIGINYSVLATICYGGSGGSATGYNSRMLAVGRVILGCLSLIYNRDIEILNFKNEKYFELKATFNANNQQYAGTLLNEDKDTRFKDRAILEGIRDKLLNKQGYVSSKEVKSITEVAPLLFNLTDLQGHISSKYNISADKTKSIAQELYEMAVISYPRTASRHLDETQDGEIKKVLELISKGYPETYNICFKKDKKIFDSSKVDSHPALTPTYIMPKNLTKEQSLVYEEIKLRFLSVFMPPNQFEQTTIITNVDSSLFITKEKILIKEGWIKLYKDSNIDKITKLNIKENDICKVENLDILDKETEPPNKYTEKTLLKAMETCGKKPIDEDDVEFILKGYSIGTADTRGTTIKRLMDLGYIEKQGKSIVTTSLGKELVGVFPVKELLDTDFTGRIQKSLKDIEKGTVKADVFMDKMKAFVISNSNKFTDNKLKSTNETKSSGGSKGTKVVGKCPDCGNDVIEGKKAFGCSNWQNGCKFSLWFTQLEKLGMKKINLTTAKKLIKGEKVHAKLNSPKTGKDFECDMLLIKEADKWNIKLDFGTKAK